MSGFGGWRKMLLPNIKIELIFAPGGGSMILSSTSFISLVQETKRIKI
jgi:hypothetical protein